MGGSRARRGGGAAGLTVERKKELLRRARAASGRAYAPYSKVRVGAAALAASGKIFTGSNVENASYGLTVCAERVAIQSAISAGEREIVALAVSSPDMRGISPCGACRQVMAEFAGREGLVVVMEGERDPRAVVLEKLIPQAFKLSRR
ncbi:MAG: cytidine deaminase [Thermoplasmata archaeon]